MSDRVQILQRWSSKIATRAAFTLLVAVAGCGDGGKRVNDARLPDAVQDDAPTAALCSAAAPAGCLYQPATTYGFTVEPVMGLTYRDLANIDRNVNIAIYKPTNAPMPAPVVLLSHGGADGKTNPLKSMDDWAPIFAKAGYVAVAIAHEGRDLPSYNALCAALHVDTNIMCGIKINWDRPHDVDRVLQYLRETAALSAVVDLSKIAHVGHSAGAGAAMMSAGVTRNFVCAQPFDVGQNCQAAQLVSLAKSDIDAVVALSPQGPGSDGFMMESFGAAAKPVFMATGLEDGDPGEPQSRVALWPLLPTSNKYKMFINHVGAQHTLFEASLEACERVAATGVCSKMREQLYSAVLAFVDAQLRGLPAAVAHLASENVTTAGQGIVTFERK